MAHELLYTLKSKKKGKVGNMGVKLDMSKAYGSVEWSCLHEALRTLGLNEKWRKLIMPCVSRVSYSVLVNEKLGTKFMPLRDSIKEIRYPHTFFYYVQKALVS